MTATPSPLFGVSDDWHAEHAQIVAFFQNLVEAFEPGSTDREVFERFVGRLAAVTSEDEYQRYKRVVRDAHRSMLSELARWGLN